jgi:tetratricopeptide (TPR) repeat protein
MLDLGRIRGALSDRGSATEALERAAREAGSGPVAHDALMQLAWTYVENDEPLTALATYERAAAAAEDDRDARAAAFHARATAAVRWGRFGDAQRDLTRVMTLQPRSQFVEQATMLMRTVEHHIEHLKLMREQYTTMIAGADAPDYRARPTLERGKVALAIGDEDAALIDLTRATTLFRLRPEKALAHAQLALAHAWRGECDEAAEHLIEADRLDPARSWLPAVTDDPHWSACRGTPGFPVWLTSDG